jgi:hypothetical protein
MTPIHPNPGFAVLVKLGFLISTTIIRENRGMIGLIPARARVLALLLCGASLGCGGGNTHRISGKVTFKGQPIPAGKIYFMPDGSKGNTGPTGYANIKEGSYDTSATGGQGIVGGPTVVAIEGFDPNAKPDKPDPSGEVTVKSLFPRYETSVDLPKGNTTKDFEVPAEAVKGIQRKGPTVVVP